MPTIACVGYVSFLLKNRKDRGKMPLQPGLKVVNFQGIGQREDQQDSFGVTDVRDTDKGMLAVLADGMGGIAGGADISNIVTSAALRDFADAPTGADIYALLLQMVMDAQQGARDYIYDHDGQLSGSTMIVAVVKDERLHFASVGDSHIYLLRKGALVHLNRDHTVATRLDEQAARGEITVEEAKSAPDRNSLTSYIGIDELELIDRTMKPIALKPYDRIMLMTDGVFGTLEEDEIVAMMDTADFYKAARQLEEAVLAKGRPHQDNFTAILLEI